MQHSNDKSPTEKSVDLNYKGLVTKLQMFSLQSIVHVTATTVERRLAVWLNGYEICFWLAHFLQLYADLWLTGDHFVNRPIRPTQLSVLSGSVNE